MFGYRGVKTEVVCKRFMAMPLKKSIKTLRQTVKYQLNILADERRLKKLKKKNKIRVAFFVLHHSVWKCDAVFRAMMEDDFFEPFIFVCPYTGKDDVSCIQDVQKNVNFFQNKGYPTVSSYNKNKSTWIDIDTLDIDIIFFTNPHKITKKDYYSKAYSKYLSIYIPYSHQISKYNNYKEQYNQQFHNMMWKIFAPHFDEVDIFKKNSDLKGRNILVTGYPATEPLINNELVVNSPWKKQDSNKLRVIFAPHHTIDTPELPYSTFLSFSQQIQSLSEKYKKNIQWAFKPHPMLKEKLYKHKDWGKEKTDTYYRFWEQSSFSQLEEGDYYDLFKTSDAMIHDSGSFLAEYLYLNKPVMYLALNDGIRNYQNPFGNKAYDSCTKGKSYSDIENFLIDLIHHKAPVDRTFFDNELAIHFRELTPTMRIMNHLKEELKNS